MAEPNLYRREDVWWLRAKVNGHRYRESSGTTDIREARKFREKRLKAEQDFIDGVRAKAKVEINEANLAKVRVDTSQTAVPDDGHGHDLVPSVAPGQGSDLQPAPPPAPGQPNP